ncbi:MAG: FkbM family methyltransferase [Candidatus Eremiobacteraeota bacterium]|nr:FkbM family methyltransferase [Candidatus Eremiobacteraeota bacterium]
MSAATIRVETVFGPMVAYPDDLITRHLLDFGAHTRPELAFLSRVVRAGDRVFDLGAHIGTFTVPLAQRVGPAGQVVAVEAVPRTFDLLRANVALNGVADRVETLCALVAPHARYDAVGVNGNTGATYFAPAEAARTGDALGIDALVSRTVEPDVIKLDLEGFEAWALTTSATVERRRPVLYAEIFRAQLARAGGTLAELDALFRALDYRLFRNAGARNAAHDDFEVAELDTLEHGGETFDVLAIPRGDARIVALLEP